MVEDVYMLEAWEAGVEYHHHHHHQREYPYLVYVLAFTEAFKRYRRSGVEGFITMRLVDTETNLSRGQKRAQNTAIRPK
jgi:hypothetical protein